MSGKKRSEGNRRKQSRRRRKKKLTTIFVLALLVVCGLFLKNKIFDYMGENDGITSIRAVFGTTSSLQERFLKEQTGKDEYPQELLELVEKNEETLEFVKDYPNREAYMGQPVDLSKDYKSGEVPLLMQWDKRWGYDSYGNGMIGLEGCGPTCLTMAYLYFTGDTEMNPRRMAEFAYENGFYSPEGTSWSLWTEGVEKLGLKGENLTLSENAMKETLNSGGLIVCSMRPGDFTTTGHFILIRGYDENGFYVNDPNRHSTSEKQWTYDEISGQIKNLWGIYD